MKTVLIKGKGASSDQLEHLIRTHRIDEVWKLNNDGSRPVPIRHFEIHDPIHFTDKQIYDCYIRYNGENPRCYPDFKIVRRKDLPMSELVKLFRGEYFGNTIAIQIGVAILEGFKKIILCGCDKYAVTEVKEIDYVKYALAIAIRQGIQIVLPIQSNFDISEHVLKIRNRLVPFLYK